MRHVDLMVPFSWFENIAKGEHHYKSGDDIQFLILLMKALKEVDDDCIIILISEIPVNFLLSHSIGVKLPGTHYIIIREYVKRRLETIAEQEKAEALAKEALEKLKAEIRKHSSYTGFTTIPEEDMYDTYTTTQFEAEIDWHCKQSLNAQLAGDRDQSAYHSMKASILSSRLDELNRKIKTLKAVDSTIKNLIKGKKGFKG